MLTDSQRQQLFTDREAIDYAPGVTITPYHFERPELDFYEFSVGEENPFRLRIRGRQNFEHFMGVYSNVMDSLKDPTEYAHLPNTLVFMEAVNSLNFPYVSKDSHVEDSTFWIYDSDVIFIDKSILSNCRLTTNENESVVIQNSILSGSTVLEEPDRKELALSGSIRITDSAVKCQDRTDSYDRMGQMEWTRLENVTLDHCMIDAKQLFIIHSELRDTDLVDETVVIEGDQPSLSETDLDDLYP